MMVIKRGGDLPYLWPVELNLLRGHRLHPPAQVVRDPDGVGVGLEVVHRYGDGEVRGEKEAEATYRSQFKARIMTP